MKQKKFSFQLNVLIERNLALVFASPGSLLFILLPIFIGWLIGIAFKQTQPSTFFVLTISAIFIGCMNTACEIVKERPILDRERFSHLNLAPYITAKFAVICFITLIQVILLIYITSLNLKIKGNIFLVFIILYLTCCAGNALGLTVSSFAKSPKSAVIAIPFLILPQIIFCKLVLGKDLKYVETIEKFTLSKWCYDALENIGFDSLDWGILASSMGILLVSSFVFLMISLFKLKIDEI